MAAVFGSVDYWVGGSAVGYGVCGAFEWVDKGAFTSLDRTQEELSRGIGLEEKGERARDVGGRLGRDANEQKVAQDTLHVQGAHFILILYICCLSSSSHLAALITLRKYFRKYKLIARIRMGLVVVFALFLVGSMIAAICMPGRKPPNPTSDDGDGDDGDGKSAADTRSQRLSFLLPMLFIIFGFSTALVCILYNPSHSSAGPTAVLPRRQDAEEKKFALPPRNTHCFLWHLGCRLVANLFLNPLIAFTVQILLAVLGAVLVLSQKFAVPVKDEGDGERWCGLQNEGDNVWGFGQTLSVVMLLLPVMSAGQVFLEGREDIARKRSRW